MKRVSLNKTQKCYNDNQYLKNIIKPPKWGKCEWFAVAMHQDMDGLSSCKLRQNWSHLFCKNEEGAFFNCWNRIPSQVLRLDENKRIALKARFFSESFCLRLIERWKTKNNWNLFDGGGRSILKTLLSLAMARQYRRVGDSGKALLERLIIIDFAAPPTITRYNNGTQSKK